MSRLSINGCRKRLVCTKTLVAAFAAEPELSVIEGSPAFQGKHHRHEYSLPSAIALSRSFHHSTVFMTSLCRRV